jgi:hypothetical protein
MAALLQLAPDPPLHLAPALLMRRPAGQAISEAISDACSGPASPSRPRLGATAERLCAWLPPVRGCQARVWIRLGRSLMALRGAPQAHQQPRRVGVLASLLLLRVLSGKILPSLHRLPACSGLNRYEAAATLSLVWRRGSLARSAPPELLGCMHLQWPVGRSRARCNVQCLPALAIAYRVR